MTVGESGIEGGEVTRTPPSFTLTPDLNTVSTIMMYWSVFSCKQQNPLSLPEADCVHQEISADTQDH